MRKRDLGVAMAIAAITLVPAAAFGKNELGHTQAFGPSAGRPGYRTVPLSAKSTATPAEGSAPARQALSKGEGAGSKWCAAQSGYQLGASFRNVYACGPAYGDADDFDTAGFQCVELSERFMWANYGDYVPGVPGGKQLVTIAGSALSVPIGTPAVNSLPVPGDVVSMWGGPKSQPYGHTAVVTAVDVDSAGDGTITIMEQNGLSSGWDSIDVSNWAESFGDPKYDGGYWYYNHIDWLEFTSKPPPPPPPYTLNYVVQPLGANTTPAALNGHGVVLGTVKNLTLTGTTVVSPFLYQNKTLSTMPPAGAGTQQPAPAGINGFGAVAAWAGASSSSATAYAASASADPVAWNPLPSPLATSHPEHTTGIDAWGDITGWVSWRGDGTPSEGVVWMHQGKSYTPELYPANHMFWHPVVAAADHFGDAVGTETYGPSKQFGVVWAPWRTAYRLDALDPAAPFSTVTGMVYDTSGTNRILTIVGSSRDSDGNMEACQWTVTVSPHYIQWDKPVSLGIEPGYANSVGVAINSTGWIAGNTAKSGTGGRAFLYRPTLGMADLNSFIDPTSGWVIMHVVGMNNSGQIVAIGYNHLTPALSTAQGLLLKPVKLPAS